MGRLSSHLKQAMQRDDRVVIYGQPLGVGEQARFAAAIDDFQHLLAAIEENYLSYIKHTAGFVHLVLNNDKIERLATRYHATPELVDQLIRSEAIGQFKASQCWGNVNGQDNDNVLISFSQLYAALFGPDAAWRALSDSLQTSYQHQLSDDYTADVVKQNNSIAQWNLGLIFDRNHQIAAPIFHNFFVNDLCTYIKEYNDVTFYNFEELKVPLIPINWLKRIGVDWMPAIIIACWAVLLVVNPDTVPFLYDWLMLERLIAITVGYYVLVWLWCLCHSSRLDNQTGLLKHFNYAKYDPHCLVKQYRQSIFSSPLF